MPIITSARVAGTTSLTAQIKYHGTPSTTFRAYLFSNPGSCDESGHGEAESAPYTSATFITDASGNGAATITGVSFVGDILSALVRLESLPYATSELSTCRTTVASTSPLVFDDSFESGFVDAWSSWSL
jgi:hypothetical protein